MITVQQQKAVKQNYLFCEEALKGQAPTPEKIMEPLAYLCPEVPKEQLKRDCAGLERGAARFAQAYEACRADGVPIDGGRVWRHITEGMTDAQKKGCLLHGYECIRRIHAQEGIAEAREAPGPPGLAELSGNELSELAARQMQELSELFASDVLREAQKTEGALEGELDPILLGAAAYAAGVQGDLPLEFQRQPELLGACAAACRTIQSEIQAAPKQKEKSELIFKITVGATAVLVGIAVAVLAGPAVTAAAEAAVEAVAAAVGPEIAGWVMHSGLAVFIKPFLSLLSISGGITGVLAGGIFYYAADRVREFYRRNKSGAAAVKRAESSTAAGRPFRRDEERENAEARA